jgi:hypothetical protein
MSQRRYFFLSKGTKHKLESTGLAREGIGRRINDEPQSSSSTTISSGLLSPLVSSLPVMKSLAWIVSHTFYSSYSRDGASVVHTDCQRKWKNFAKSCNY